MNSQVLRPGPQRPPVMTVWSMVVDRVDLEGSDQTDLLARLQAIPYEALPDRVRANPSKQQPGSSKWWGGYISGCLRRGFLVAGR